MKSVSTQTDPTKNSGTQTNDEFDTLEDIVYNIKNQLDTSCSNLKPHFDTENFDLEIFRSDAESKENTETFDEMTLKSDEFPKEPISLYEMDQNVNGHTLENHYIGKDCAVLALPSPLSGTTDTCHKTDDTSSCSVACYNGSDVGIITILKKHCENLNFTCGVRLVNELIEGIRFSQNITSNTLERVAYSLIHQAHPKSSALPETIFSSIGCVSPTASLLLSLGNTSRSTL